MTVASAMREIEYKYFVDTDLFWEFLSENPDLAIMDENIVQHYIAKSDGNTVRLRASEISGETTYVLCVKGQGDGINEIEYVVSETFALPIINGAFDTPSVAKRRLTFALNLDDVTLKLEVDIYEDNLSGLIVAEVEVPEDGFDVPMDMLPEFVIVKVSDRESEDFSNYSLARMSKVESDALITAFKHVFG